ncbi:unnamed protein product [Rotaria sordida]|uniref:DUF4139 domain-containing protein n=1 Tax=Rotaria sordida TaxID=392033 RepID=A0A814WK74_9BILA|nr:unnamed protein product [Rotaria sordida]CAF1231631.1 unnamed protein product [Rotaria sordida]
MHQRMYFSQDVYANIVRGSLSIEGIPIESKQVVPHANNLENQTIFVRRYANEEPQECRVIQADELLLQNSKTKRYFRPQRHELEYVTMPEQKETEVTYVLKQQGKATLTYQIHGISWLPQYELSILSDDRQHTFQAFAEITNGTKQEYRIDRTELFSGDVHLQGEVEAKRRRDRSRSLYLYSIDQPFILLPKSTFGLPFINATIQIRKYVGLTLSFTSHTQIRKLQRKYRIESIDKFLPGGPLTIREQGHLVGVTTLPDMSVGDKHTFSCGQDSDVSLNRQVKLISRERHSAMYAVHLTFKNVKSTPVKFEYNEIIDNEDAQFKIILKGSDDQRAQIEVTANGIQIEHKNGTDDLHGMLAANGGEQIYEYEIRLNYPKKSNSSSKRRRE